MATVFLIGAALKSERVKTAKRINQCKSFVKLAVEAEGLAHLTAHQKRIVTFECESFGFQEEKSSPKWNEVFTYKKEDNRVTIEVPNSYEMGPAIPGYQ